MTATMTYEPAWEIFCRAASRSEWFDPDRRVKHTSFSLDWRLVALLLDTMTIEDRDETIEKLVALQRELSR